MPSARPWRRRNAYDAQLSLPDPATGKPAVRRVRLEDPDGIPAATVRREAGSLRGMKSVIGDLHSITFNQTIREARAKAGSHLSQPIDLLETSFRASAGHRPSTVPATR